jgi:hypothetical protein
MTKISEAEFARIVDGIIEDRDTIIKHNPLGTDEEILLWMLLSCLISYLNLTDVETPCFTGMPDAETYRNAVLFVLNERRTEPFLVEQFLDRLIDAS